MSWYKPRKNKYGVSLEPHDKIARTVNGRACASLGEARRYKELLLCEQLGAIKDLKAQQKTFTLAINGFIIATYRPDFSYVDLQTGSESPKTTIEDFKGAITDEFKMKWALMHALYGEEYNLLLTGTQYEPRRLNERNNAKKPTKSAKRSR